MIKTRMTKVKSIENEEIIMAITMTKITITTVLMIITIIIIIIIIIMNTVKSSHQGQLYSI